MTIHEKGYILSIDQGTTSSRAILFDKNFKIIDTEQIETTQIFPKPGWVEQDATEIWETQLFVCRKLIARSGIDTKEIVSLGITNQRESTVIWDKNNGVPIYNAIIWQDNRTDSFCEDLKRSNISDYIENSTGLIIDSYFSATKIKWILDNVKGAKKKAINGDLLFGTIDSWLVWNLSDRKLHITDYSNASRTMLFNINSLTWDKKILDYLGIPEHILPKVKESSYHYCNTAKGILGKTGIPIGSMIGAQQAALFGHSCFYPGDIKNTYGTGCFMLMNTGKKNVKSQSGLISTIAWKINNEITYALEGSIFVAGAAVKWLRDNMKIIESSEETEKIAFEIKDNGNVYFVPAFAGLGAPHWNMQARGCIIGITGNTNYKHIVRAALESMAYQTKDIINSMEKDSGITINSLYVDGGASKNNFIMQFQSDILQIEINRPRNTEATAFGAALMAGMAVKFWNMKDINNYKPEQEYFSPKMQISLSKNLYNNWLKAVENSKNTKF